MHGFSSGSVLVVNAEVDSMGGVVGGEGVGAVNKTPPQRAVIEKVQAELRQEYDVREERRRELEFLEKGGDPLEFKLSGTSSLSVQSTSATNQQPNLLVSSEAKGSSARPASPHGGSIESSGRPVVRQLCETDCADNLMFFDAENEFPEVGRKVAHPSKCISAPSKQPPQLDVHDNPKELKKSPAFNVPRNSYRRRSRPNRDGAKSGSNDAVLARSTSLSSRHPIREVKDLSSDVEIQKDQTVLVSPNSVPPSKKKGTTSKSSENPSEWNGVMEAESTANASKTLINDHDDQQKLLTARRTPGIDAEDKKCAHIKEDLSSAVFECQPCVAITQLEGKVNGGGGSNPNTVAVASKVLDSESDCPNMGSNANSCNLDELSTNQKGTGNVKEHILTPIKEEVTEFEEPKKSQPLDAAAAVLSNDNNLVNQIQENELQSASEKEVKRNAIVLGNILNDSVAVQSVQANTTVYSETDNAVSGSGTGPIVTNQESVKFSSVELPEPKLSIENSAVAMEKKESNANAVRKADEDVVLKEAGVIEAKRRRIAALSAAVVPVENRRKSHWDYVLDEMKWLANDFAQERIWKMSAAAQLCHRVAYTSQFKFQEKHCTREPKRVAHLLSEAVIQFWSSVQDSSKVSALTSCKDSALSLRQYAVNFLNFNNQTEAPATADRKSDLGTMCMSLDDDLAQENFFYLVPSGAIKTYKKLIELHVSQYERTGSSLQEEVDTSAFDDSTAFGALQNAYEEDEGDTDCDISRPYGYAQKKRKILPNGFGRRSYEVGADLMYTQSTENKHGTQRAVFMGKRPASSLNVSIPTRRIRTAPRQRVPSPFIAGTSGCFPLQSKADASSGDTSSFHDDQSNSYGGSIMPNNLEVESVRGFEKKVPFDSTEVSKPRKKKKAKHLSSAYEQRWQVDSNFQSEQRDHSKKRSEGHQLESNGCGGLLGQHISKKPKVMRPSPLDNSFDNIPPVAGSVPSPVASQMSNMANPNIKIIGGGERSRKTKALKVPSRKQGSGSPWSQFEDQALIVLVHDMGPNWELVSDAINCTLQFKYIYRKPNECKERHMFLMDPTTGDGPDSADDSGSSQPYPSTLPGIPKGSARQLFQQLQRPMEEETLKSHFEKIILIEQKQHNQKSQSSNHEPRQLQQPHSSHMLVLSKVCPNNLSGGPVLTPLDLWAPSEPPDIPSLGYQSPSNNCLPVSEGPATTGNNFSSSPTSLNPNVRDVRFPIPRSTSLSIEEEQRMQQYNQMHPARNVPTSGTDRGMHILPAGNRSVPVARPRFQNMAPSPTLNSGPMHSSGMVTMPIPANMRTRDALHMMRPNQSQESQRQILAPELHLRVPQANQGVPSYGKQTGVPPMPVPSRSLHQQSLPVSSQQPQMLNHRPQASNPQQHAYAVRLMKERQLQQRIMLQQQQQQQQQFVASNAVLPYAQPSAQLPISTSMPNVSQVRPKISSPPVQFSPLAVSSSVPHQHKHKMPPHGLLRNSQAGGSGLANHMSKQKRQPQQQQHPQAFQQSARNHPEQRPQPSSQQHTKHVKGVTGGNLMKQSTSSDSCLPNVLSTERSEQAMHSVQAQALHSGSDLNSVQSTNKLVSPNSLSQRQPMYQGQVATTNKNTETMASHSDNNNNNMVPISSAFHQSVAPLDTASSNHQQPQQKVVNHNPPAPQRVLQASRQVNRDMTNKLPSGESPIEQCNMSNNSHPCGTEPRGDNDVKEGSPVLISSADQTHASEQLHDSFTSTPPSSFTSPGIHLANDAGEPMESIGCKQSSQQAPSAVSQPQQPTSPVPQLQQQPLTEAQQS